MNILKSKVWIVLGLLLTYGFLLNYFFEYIINREISGYIQLFFSFFMLIIAVVIIYYSIKTILNIINPASFIETKKKPKNKNV